MNKRLLTGPLTFFRPEAVEGRTASGFDVLSPIETPVITRAGSIISALIVLSFLVDTAKAEVLQRISDDIATPLVQPPSSKQDDRRITYRVVCSADDEALPDCEKPFDDVEGNEQAGLTVPVPDLPTDPEDAIDKPEPEIKPALQRQTTNPKPVKANANKTAKGNKTSSKKKSAQSSVVKKAAKHQQSKSKNKPR